MAVAPRTRLLAAFGALAAVAALALAAGAGADDLPPGLLSAAEYEELIKDSD